MKQDMIVILDLGSTENTVLAREIRELGVYSEIHPHDITEEEIKALDNVKGIILNGGENRVVDGKEVEMTHDLLEQGAQFVRPAMEFMGFSGKPAGYFIIFCVCAVAYLIGWVVMKALVPKYKPIVLE